MNKLKKLFTQIVFWSHFPIIILWFGLFLVPSSIWTERVIFHFWYLVIIIIIQLIWSILIFKKLDLICPQTTLMQYLRGYKLNNKKNYRHSFIAEFLKKLKINISYKSVNIILLITLIIVTVQYFWFR